MNLWKVIPYNFVEIHENVKDQSIFDKGSKKLVSLIDVENKSARSKVNSCCCFQT